MRRRREGAQSMVEFALLAPLFFMLLLGVFDFGRAIYYYVSIAHGAREAARYAVARDNGGVNDLALLQQARLDLFSVPVDKRTSCSPDLCSIPTPPLTNLTYGQISPSYDQRLALQGSAATPGTTTHYPLTITLTFYFQPVTPIISQLVGNSITLTVQTTMVTEY